MTADAEVNYLALTWRGHTHRTRQPHAALAASPLAATPPPGLVEVSSKVSTGKSLKFWLKSTRLAVATARRRPSCRHVGAGLRCSVGLGVFWPAPDAQRSLAGGPSGRRHGRHTHVRTHTDLPPALPRKNKTSEWSVCARRCGGVALVVSGTAVRRVDGMCGARPPVRLLVKPSDLVECVSACV